MPCSCEKPVPEYPETDNWGPVLWAILHTLAEHSGKNILGTSRDDEKRQWTNIIHGLPKIIPCPKCREHAEAWIVKTPVTAIKLLSADELHEWLVNYFYNFHESVNARNGKPSFDKALLSQTYGSISVAGAMRRLKPFIEVAIRLSGLTLVPWQKWTGYVIILSSFYGI
jgi:Erv1 / Alr family